MSAISSSRRVSKQLQFVCSPVIAISPPALEVLLGLSQFFWYLLPAAGLVGLELPGLWQCLSLRATSCFAKNRFQSLLLPLLKMVIRRQQWLAELASRLVKTRLLGRLWGGSNLRATVFVVR